MSIFDSFTKKWAKKIASQMLDVYKANKKDDPAISDGEILRRTLLGSPEKEVAKIVLSDENIWEENKPIIKEVIIQYIIEVWKSNFKTQLVPENKKSAIVDGVSEAINSLGISKE